VFKKQIIHIAKRHHISMETISISNKLLYANQLNTLFIHACAHNTKSTTVVVYCICGSAGFPASFSS